MKHTIGRRILATLLLGILCLSVAACAAPADSSDGDITLTLIRIGNDEGEANYWKGLIERFEAANPGIKVAYDDAAIGEPFETKVNTMFESGKGPDLIGNGVGALPKQVETGRYMPITDYINAWDGKDDMIDIVLDKGTYKGDVYGLAYSTTPFVFAYRTDYFEEANLDPNSPPATWDELVQYAKALTVVENDQIVRAGFAFPMTAGNMVEFDIFAFGNGGGFYDAEGNPTVDAQANIDALAFLQSFIAEVNIPYNSNEVNPFIKGNAAMTLINNVALEPILSDPEMAGKVAIAFPPTNGTEANFAGCNMLSIGKDCENPDAAFKFIEMALSPDEVLRRAKEIKIPVTRQSLVEEYTALDPFNAVRVKCVEFGISMPKATWTPVFQRVRNLAVEKALYDNVDAAQALQDAQAELLTEIEEAQ